MKAIYIAFQTLEKASGITNKIIAQYRGLVNAGLDTDFCHYEIVNNKWCFVVNESVIGCIGSGLQAHLALYYNYEPVYKYIKDNKIDFVYIRYTQFSTPFFIRFLKKIHALGVVTYMEIPTFPYDTEYTKGSILNRLQRYIERKSRVGFKKYVKRVVTVQKYVEILGIPAIEISNGLDCSQIPLREPRPHKGINFIAVAHLGEWHGYDRLIEGMGLYYKNTSNPVDLNFYIVGTNHKVYDFYMSVAHKYGIEDRIHFEGVKSGRELDAFFDIADIAIGCLACHRKGVFDAKPLKSIEYAARGIPFIYSEINTDFDDKDFIIKARADDTPVLIEEILLFIQKNSFTPAIIRDVVINSLSWDSQMRIVVDTFKTA